MAGKHKPCIISLLGWIVNPINRILIVPMWLNRGFYTYNIIWPQGNELGYEDEGLGSLCVLLIQSERNTTDSHFPSMFKGSVSRVLRWVLLYIIQKLFSRPSIASHKILTFLKGQYVSAILECENAFICAIWTHKTKRKTGNMVYKYFSVIYHSERLLRISILRKHPFSSAFNIVWMNPYHRTRLCQPVLCILWTNPLII